MQSTKVVTAVDAGGIDTTLWEPQELGIAIYIYSTCIKLPVNVIANMQILWKLNKFCHLF